MSICEFKSLINTYDYCRYHGGCMLCPKPPHKMTDVIENYLKFLIENSPDDPDIKYIKQIYDALVSRPYEYEYLDFKISHINKLMSKPLNSDKLNFAWCGELFDTPQIDRL